MKELEKAVSFVPFVSNVSKWSDTLNEGLVAQSFAVKTLRLFQF